MTLETKTSNPADLELEEFSSNSKTTKKAYAMTKHVTKKMSSSTSVTSSSSSVSGNTNEELSSLFNNDNSLLNITDNMSTNKLMNFDVLPPMDFNMGLDNMNLDMQNQLSSMMEKEINSTCQKMIGMSTKKISKASSISASTSHDSLSSSSSSIHNKKSSKNKISSINNKAIVASENGTVKTSSTSPFVVKIPLGEDILPEDLEVSLSEEKNGLKMMTVTAAQEKTSQTETTKSKSSRRIIKKFSLPPNTNTDKISSTFVCDGNLSYMKIEAPLIMISQTPEGDIPIPIKFEEF